MMRAEKNSKARPRKKTVTRIFKLALALIVVLIVLVLFLIPAFVSSEKGRQVILAKIDNSIAGQTNFADLSMGWFRGIKVADVSFNDSLGQVAVQVKQIAAKPHYGSILTGNLSFGETIVDEPKVEINLRDTQAKKAEIVRQEPSAGKRARPVVLPIKKIDLVLNDGNLKVTGPKAKTVELSQINSKVNLRPPGQQTNFDLNMAVVDGGRASKIQVASRVTTEQQTGWSLEGTSGNLTVEINDLDIESLGPIFALAGVEVQAKGLIAGRIESEMKDGQFENLSADIKGKNLDITDAKLKGDRLQTSSLDVGIKLNCEKETINIDNLQIKTDWASVTASGVVPTTFKSFADFFQADSNYDLKGRFDCDLAAVLLQMPKTLGLKEGMQITSGRLNGNVETSTKAGQRQIQAQGTLTGLEGTVKGKKITLSEPVRAQAQISSDKAGINFDKLDVSAPFAKINCTGTSELLKYNADVDLAKLQSELGQFINIDQYQMAGELLEKGQISIKEKRITTSGTSVAKNLRFSSKEGVTASEPMANVAYAFDIDTENNTIIVDSMEADASFGRVSVKDAVVPWNKKSPEPLHLPISANNIDLSKLQPFAVLFASFPQQMQLAGVAESQISVSSKKDSYRIVTEATKIKNFKLISPGKEPFESNEVSLVFDAEVNPKQKAINVIKLQLESPQIRIKKGEFKQTNKAGKTKLEGLIDCEYDWSALSTVTGPFLPEGLRLQGERKDTINFTSEYPSGQTDKLLANLSTKTKLGFEKAQYMGLNFGPTDVDVQIQNGLLKIAPFATTVNDGQFNFAAQTDFKQKPALLKIAEPMQIIKDININDETTRKLLRYLSPIFANAVNVSGIANFNCEQLTIPLSTAAKKQAEVVGTISINKLRLQGPDLLSLILSLTGTSTRGVDITIRPTRFILRNGFLRYDDMQMEIGDSPVNFKGVIGLDKTLNMTVTLPGSAERLPDEG
ncbi:MAG: YhdP family protein [Planctomycetota bacterium]|jgi:hypothetical protein